MRSSSLLIIALGVSTILHQAGAQTSPSRPASRPPSGSVGILALGENPTDTVDIQPACPVAFSARRTASTYYAASGRPAHTLRLQVFFGRPASSRIRQATVTVHGSSGGVRLLPLLSGNAADAADTFQLRPDHGELLNAGISTNQLTSIKWAALEALEFEDGSSWKAPLESVCRIDLTGLLLVRDR